MKKIILILGLVLILSAAWAAISCQAQEAPANVMVPMNEETIDQNMVEEPMTTTGEDTYFSYGVVVKASANDIVISEYDLDTEENVDTTYVVNPDTTYENIKSAAELKANDEVEIEYLEQEGKRIAKVVTKEEAYKEDQSEGGYNYNMNMDNATVTDETKG